MEINYCAECRSRVSSVDIDAGKGVAMVDKVYCDGCAKKLGLYEQAPAPAKTPHVKPVTRRPGSGLKPAPDRPRPHTGGRPSGPPIQPGLVR